MGCQVPPPPSIGVGQHDPSQPDDSREWGYTLSDGQNNRLLVDGNVAIAHRWEWEAFGKARADAGSTPSPFGYGGEQQDASADTFASADQAQMNNARGDGSIVGPDVTFAKNRLVVIVPKDNPGRLHSAADIANPGIRFVTAAPEVPIGVYTQNMFDKMSQISVFGADFKDRANANIVSRDPNVRQVVAKVQLGEADAAVVYCSDVTPSSAPDLMTIPIPDDLNTLATCPIAPVANGPQAELGQAFIDMVMAPSGQAILGNWNFGTVGPTMLVPAPSADHTALILTTAR